jgi:sugar O-acyltransferase (sialic acid O-acetyltransferase NeuD family)
MPKVIVVGGTGQYSVMKPIIERGGGIITAVFDDVIDCSPDKDVPFYRLNELDEWINREEVCLRDTIRKLCYYFVVAVGNPHAQFRIDTSKMLFEKGFLPLTLIHHSATIEGRVQIGTAPQIHAGVIINPGARIGNYCILNTGSIVEHDCVLGNGVELGPRAVVCGNVSVGDNTWVAAGAVVKDHLSIGDNTIIGCGANVVKNVGSNVVVVGNPAKEKK